MLLLWLTAMMLGVVVPLLPFVPAWFRRLPDEPLPRLIDASILSIVAAAAFAFNKKAIDVTLRFVNAYGLEEEANPVAALLISRLGSRASIVFAGVICVITFFLSAIGPLGIVILCLYCCFFYLDWQHDVEIERGEIPRADSNLTSPS